MNSCESKENNPEGCTSTGPGVCPWGASQSPVAQIWSLIGLPVWEPGVIIDS